MARLKGLLFRQEIKNRRVSKIKSKLFHKLKKKERERDE
jgi:U3 small nucleolar RNA-associated protein 14